MLGMSGDWNARLPRCCTHPASVRQMQGTPASCGCILAPVPEWRTCAFDAHAYGHFCALGHGSLRASDQKAVPRPHRVIRRRLCATTWVLVCALRARCAVRVRLRVIRRRLCAARGPGVEEWGGGAQSGEAGARA